ncbi:MAG: HDOD domain-containing protein [Nitrosomonadales bacterium]|nr:HDOD domain-containing protein [Nitrosomonadales bacterium]
MTETPANLAEKLSAAVEKMPAFPKSVQRILEITRDIHCQPKELVAVIEKDPVMTMKLLRIINSAYYNFPRQVTTVNQSLLYLGLNTVKNMALSFAAMGVLPQQNAAGFDMQRYLLHSLTTASLARAICQKFGNGDADPGDCYLAGLLHDFGKVVFAQFMPAEFREALALCRDRAIPLHEAERQIIGADHSVVGAMLVGKWQFPKLLTDAISQHHGDIPPGNTMLASLFVADQISKQMSAGDSGNPVAEELPSGLAARFGGMDDLIARLGDLSKIAEEAQSFARIGKEAPA